MSKTNIIKKAMIAVFTIILIFIVVQYYKFINLRVYEWNGDLVMKDGITYQCSTELSDKYMNGELKTEKTIGWFKEDNFLGFKTMVIKLKGFDEKDTFLIKGLMFDGIYTKSRQ